MWLRNHKTVGFTPMQVNRNTVQLCACTPREHKTNAVYSTEDTEEGAVQHMKFMENCSEKHNLRLVRKDN